MEEDELELPLSSRKGKKSKKAQKPPEPVKKKKKKKKRPTEKKFECKECGKKFYYNCKLQGHILVHTGQKPYVCKECGKAFNSHYSLKTHKYIHTNEKPFKCSFCSYACRDSSTLRKHQHRHMGLQKIFQCKMCNKPFRHKYLLKDHVAEAHMNVDLKTIPCPQCGKLFKKIRDMRTHIRIRHERTRSGRCPVCDKYIADMANLPSHLNTHLDARPFRCAVPHCGRAFKDKSSLRKHKGTHEPNTHECEICYRMFYKEEHLQRHLVVVHGKSKCVECDHCGVRFYSKAYLIKHIKQKHSRNRKKYICDICGLKTYNKPSIVMHIKYGHQGDDDRECKICHIMYKKHIYLKQHYKNTHKIYYKAKRRLMPKIKGEPPDDTESLHSIDLLDIEKEEVFDQESNPTPQQLFDGESNPLPQVTLPVELQTVIECERMTGVPDDIFDSLYVDSYTNIVDKTKPKEPPKSKYDEDTDKKTFEIQKNERTKLLEEARKKQALQALERARQIYNERMKALFNGVRSEDSKKPIKIKLFNNSKRLQSSNKSDEITDNNKSNNNNKEIKLNNDDEKLHATTIKVPTDDQKALDGGKNAKASSNNDLKSSKANKNNRKINKIPLSKRVEKNIGKSKKIKKDNNKNITKVDENSSLEENIDSQTAKDTQNESTSCNTDKELAELNENEKGVTDDNTNGKMSSNDDNEVNIHDELENIDEDKTSNTNIRTNAEQNSNESSDANSDANDEDFDEDDEEWSSKKQKSSNGKINFNSHQCYVCFKLYETKEKLLDHCKDHFDVCNSNFLKKCPLCPYVTKLAIRRHMKFVHGLDVKVPYGRIKDKKDNTDGCRYYFELDDPLVSKMEVIPSVKNLNKIASMKFDKKNKELKSKTIAKTKLVKKGKEWIVETEKIKLDKDVIFPKFDEEELKNFNIKIGDTNSYFDGLKKMYHIAKKTGKTMLFPCQSCEKVCRNLAALKLHNRKHEDNPKPFRKKVWKHKLKGTLPEKKIVKKVETSNRTAKPKPIQNKHKCDPELKKFYENNIRGGDIEFWQFLKIFNKMGRDEIKDFKDLEGRYEYGIPENIKDDSEVGKADNLTNNNESSLVETDVTNKPSTSSDVSTSLTKTKRKSNPKPKKPIGKTENIYKKVYKKVVRLSKSEYMKRNLVKQKLREKIAQEQEKSS